MENLSEARGERPAPQALLTLEISRMVSRVLAGEEIDTAASGDELALRFPGAGMTGTMIADAIDRAAGMVGMIRDGGGVVDTPFTLTREDLPLSMEEEIAAAVREQNPVERNAEEPEEQDQEIHSNGDEHAEEAVQDASAEDPPQAPAPERVRPTESRPKAGGAFAALRRAFSRS